MKIKLFIIVAFLTLAACVPSYAQVRPKQKLWDWSSVVRLPAPINSEFDDQAAVLTKDERTMYFSSNRPGSLAASRDIWVSTRKSKNSPWRTPVNLGPKINSTGTELVRSITSDGRVLLFQSDRSGGGFGQADIWAIARNHANDASDWDEPVNLGSVINTQYTELASNYFFADGVRKLFFSSSKPGGFGGPDIYESEIDDLGFGLPVNVVELNTQSIETCFWVRDDGLEIIFSSNRPNLSEDRSFDDLWTATRDSVFAPWSTAVSLGPSVNSAGYRDVGPFVTLDGRTLLTASNRPGGMASGTFDIYMATRGRAAE